MTRIKLIKKAQDLINKKLNSQKLHHSIRVANYVKLVSKNVGYGDLEILILSALLHDLAESKSLNGDNARESAEVAVSWLKKQGLAKNDLVSIKKCILATTKDKLSKYSLEESIVHDANILDSMGLIGILRVAYIMGKNSDKDSLEDLIIWFEKYSKELQKNLINDVSKEIAGEKSREIIIGAC